MENKDLRQQNIFQGIDVQSKNDSLKCVSIDWNETQVTKTYYDCDNPPADNLHYLDITLVIVGMLSAILFIYIKQK